MVCITGVSRSRRVAALVVVACSVVALLSGCGMGKIDTTVSSQPVLGAAMQGRMRGGNQPVTGATIQLYAAGIGGYGSAPTPLLASAVTTDSSGGFSITGLYSCPDADGDGDSQVYLVGSGGNPGLQGTVNNSALVMMAALGSCNQLIAGGASIFIDINEVSTVAAAYSLAQFALPNPSGHGILVGTSSGNVAGLNSAMKTVNNLVDLRSGTALSITPFYKALGGTPGGLLNSSYVPQARINTLADALAPCVNSNGADGACTGLFNAAKPPSGPTPTDTLQAILSIAQNPGNNVSAVWNRVSSTPPFQPTLTSAPNDWTLALTYTGGGMGVNLQDPNQDPGNASTMTSMAIDANGNIWLTSYNACTDPITYDSTYAVLEFDNQGNALSPASTAANAYCGGYQPKFNGSLVLKTPQSLAVDLNGYIWVGEGPYDNSGRIFTKMASDGTVSQGNYAGPLNQYLQPYCANALSLAVDASNNIWAGCQSNNGVSTGGIGAISTVDASAVGGQGEDGPNISLGSIGALALDSNGNAWGVSFLNSTQTSHLYQFGTTPSNGLFPVVSDHSTSGRTFVGSVVTDGPGNVFSTSTTPGIINVLPVGSSTVNTLSYPLPSGAAGAGPLAIDGAGNLWGASFSAPSGVFPPQTPIPPYLFQMTSSGTLLSPSGNNVYGYSGTGGGGETQPILANNYQNSAFAGIAVDGSGNVWVANSVVPYAFFTDLLPGEQLVEFIGIAPPVLTPLALALQYGEVGIRPQAVQEPGKQLHTDSSSRRQ